MKKRLHKSASCPFIIFSWFHSWFNENIILHVRHCARHEETMEPKEKTSRQSHPPAPWKVQKQPEEERWVLSSQGVVSRLFLLKNWFKYFDTQSTMQISQIRWTLVCVTTESERWYPKRAKKRRWVGPCAHGGALAPTSWVEWCACVQCAKVMEMAP